MLPRDTSDVGFDPGGAGRPAGHHLCWLALFIVYLVSARRILAAPMFVSVVVARLLFNNGFSLSLLLFFSLDSPFLMFFFSKASGRK